MSAVGTFFDIPLMGFRRIPQIGSKQLIYKQRSGVEFGDLIDTGEHAPPSSILLMFDEASAENVDAKLAAIGALIGATGVLVQGSYTSPIVVLQGIGTQSKPEMGNAAGGVNAGSFVLDLEVIVRAVQ